MKTLGSSIAAGLALVLGLLSTTPARAEGSEAVAAPSAVAVLPDSKPGPRQVRDRNAGKRVGLIAGGTILLGVSYGLPCATARGVWCVPFAGPLLAIAKRHREDNQSSNEEDGIVPPVFVYTVFGMVSFLQLGGAMLVTSGVLLPRREVEVASRRITLLPLLSPSTLGVAAVGTL